MDVRFTATETVEIGVPDRIVPIDHYLRQPQRLVQAIADPKRMEVLSDDQFRLKMRSISFMDLYHFQPTVVLKVWTGASGTVYLQSESCEIRGIDYINNRFSLQVKGKLVPESRDGQTLLRGKADLEVKVALPPPLWLTPAPLLEMTGNSLLKSVLLRIKQRLVSQIVKDYLQWAQNQGDGWEQDEAIAEGLTVSPVLKG
jgi:hypothetical protein